MWVGMCDVCVQVCELLCTHMHVLSTMTVQSLLNRMFSANRTLGTYLNIRCSKFFYVSQPIKIINANHNINDIVIHYYSFLLRGCREDEGCAFSKMIFFSADDICKKGYEIQPCYEIQPSKKVVHRMTVVFTCHTDGERGGIHFSSNREDDTKIGVTLTP